MYAKEIIRKLDLLVKLTALSVTRGREFRDQVKMLSDIGLGPKEIAELLGKTANTISVTLHLMKKKGGTEVR